jgi:aminoglycoside/choline kinase family phosphotransferase
MLIGHYVALRRAADAAFDADSFHAAYAIAGALRTAKNMGAFTRLAGLGNTRYISHLPRLRAYLARSLSHPFLSAFALWYERNITPQ